MGVAATSSDHPARKMTPAAERVLEVASSLFYSNGIRAVGMDRIAAEADVTKKTIYDHFGSKDALVATYLRCRDDRWRARLCETLDELPEQSPRERILGVFDALGTWMQQENSRGCGFVNAHAELADPDHPGRRAILEQKAWLLELFGTLAEQGNADDPARVAEMLFILYEGATVADAFQITPDAAAAAGVLASHVLDTQVHR